MKNIIFLFSVSLVLSACSGGGGGGGTTLPTPTVPPVATVVLLEGETHWGLLKAPVTKVKSFTYKNVSGFSSKTLTMTGVSGSLTIQNDNCTGKVLAANESCTFEISAHPTSSETLNQNLTLRQDGTISRTNSMAFISVDYTVPSKRVAQALLTAPNRQSGNDGSWSDGTAFDMGTTVLASWSLIENKAKTNYSLSDTSINLNAELQNTLNYLSKDSGANIDFLNNKEVVVSQWDRPNPVGGMKTKEILPFVLAGINQANNFLTNTNHSSFVNYVDYLNSRKLDVNEDNARSHYAYIMDRNRWENTYPSLITPSTLITSSNYQIIGELMIKDVWLTMKTLLANGQSTKVTDLSLAAYLNFARTSLEIKDEFSVVYQYSATEFSNSVFNEASIPQPLADFTTCRAVAYQAAILSVAATSGNLDAVKQGDLISTSLPYLFMVLKNNFTNTNSLGRFSCIPMMALAYSLSPKGLTTNAEKTAVYLELINNINSGSYPANGAGSPLILSEALQAISGFIN